MKIKSVILCAAATIFAAACNMEKDSELKVQAPDVECEVSFTAHTENAPDSKVALGTSSAGKPQTFWENGDRISVYSSAQEESSKAGFTFSTELEANASSADFKYAGEDFVEGNYIAVYPCLETSRAVNFTAQPDNQEPQNYEGNAYRIAESEIPSSQTLVAGGFDRSAMMMIAYAEESGDLNFKNAVALVKFKVSGSDIVSGRISAADKISGIYRADILAETLEPVMVDYKKSTSASVSFAAPDNAPFTPDVEYYVAVRPTALTEGFNVLLNDVVVMSYPEVKEFRRNTIYDLGTLASPEKMETMELYFDFTDATAMAGWPTVLEASTDPTAQFVCPYMIDGVTYEFISRQPVGAAGTNWPYFSSEEGAVILPKSRYLGLPAVDGYKLIKVKFVIRAGTAAKYIISRNVTSDSETPEIVSGGEEQSNSGATEFTFNLTGTEAGVQYWLRGKSKAPRITSMTLTYAK